jgi:hypothetical protein
MKVRTIAAAGAAFLMLTPAALAARDDATVRYASGIDEGARAEQKLGCLADPGDSGDVDHQGVRTLYGENRYDLRYWHASGRHRPHDTLRGWSPLKAVFRATTRVGDGLPR